MNDLHHGIDDTSARLGWAAQVHESIPQLAWAAVCENSFVTIHHGSGVEKFDHGIFEGAWAGNFGDGQFASAGSVFGSGVLIEHSEVLFVTPCHTLETLFFQSIDDRFYVSNSAAFLLSVSNSTPKWDRDISKRFATAILGIERYDRFVFDTDNGPVRRVLHDNLRWSASSPLQTERKPQHPDFSNFGEYQELLVQELRSLFANAADDRRNNPFRPLATCSSGYDSAAVLALASGLGCDRGVTIATARGGEYDSGETIAEPLGVQLTSYSRLELGQMTDIHEFFATGLGGGDIVYKSFEPELSGSLLLTGFLGDGVWSLDIAPLAVLERGDSSGMTLGEFRRRTNFVHVPVPFIAGRLHPSIARISKSREMASFSIGGSYDRPIPRRIAEEAGVSRNAFGMNKKAASIITHDRTRHPPEFRAEVDRFTKSLPLQERLATWLLSKIHLRRRIIIRNLERRADASRSKLSKSLLLWFRDCAGGETRIFRRCTPTASAEFCVSITQLKRRYSI